MASGESRPTREGTTLPQPFLTALVVLVTMFGLAWIWEFHVEAPVLGMIGFDYNPDFEESHRWHFVLTATGFAALSLILPAILLARAIRALDDARRQAEAANEAKTRFLANMSHELRTPLNAIIGFSEFIRDGAYGELDARYREYADDIHDSGRQLLALIDDVLDFARAAEGTLQTNPREFDLGATLHAMERMVRPLADSRKLAVSTRVAPDLPPVHADERLLKQALFNLLSNCIKFTPAEGRVELAARRDGDAVVLTVTDTGIGIAPDDLPKVLQPFSQADTSLARRYGGAGLGVPLARQFVEQMGGRFELTSTAGKGTTVTIALPHL